MLRGFCILVLLLVLATMVGCTKTEEGAVIGGAGGAGLGAIIGNQVGSTAGGAAIGGVAGAAAGALIGHELDKK